MGGLTRRLRYGHRGEMLFGIAAPGREDFRPGFFVQAVGCRLASHRNEVMAMSAFPLPLVVADHVLADLRLLNAQESGAYLRLLLIAQRSKGCTLPDDDVKLARWARVDLPTWRCIKPVVMAFWSQANGRWTHKRATRPGDFAGASTDVARRSAWQGERPLVSSTAAEGESATDAVPPALPDPATVKPSDLRELARSHGAGAIRLLAAILNDPTAPPRARLTAAQTLLDRGFAKPNRESDRSEDRPRAITFRRIIVTPGSPEAATP
jgi:uncharacterized protein YdaU (DUF1376 family)